MQVSGDSCMGLIMNFGGLYPKAGLRHPRKFTWDPKAGLCTPRNFTVNPKAGLRNPHQFMVYPKAGTFERQ